jgi:hypothetical protein
MRFSGLRSRAQLGSPRARPFKRGSAPAPPLPHGPAAAMICLVLTIFANLFPAGERGGPAGRGARHWAGLTPAFLQPAAASTSARSWP